jgi:hypothetical protein
MIVLLWQLFVAYFKIGLFGFGGGYAMLALLEYEIVQANQWLSLAEFVDIIAVAEMTPGPVAINAATFTGYRVGGFGGAANRHPGGYLSFPDHRYSRSEARFSLLSQPQAAPHPGRTLPRRNRPHRFSCHRGWEKCCC